MAGRPRKPTALQVASGRDKVHPGRYRERKKNEPTGLSGLGDPPDYIVDSKDCLARSAWRQYSIEIPWLTESDRAIIEAAVLIRGEIMAGNVPGIQKLTLLRAISQSLGATPADKSKINGVGGGEGDDKPAAEDDIFKE